MGEAIPCTLTEEEIARTASQMVRLYGLRAEHECRRLMQALHDRGDPVGAHAMQRVLMMVLLEFETSSAIH